MEKKYARAAAATVGDLGTEEREMDMLLSEIPHVTSPLNQQRAATVGPAAIGHGGNGVPGGAAGRFHGYAAQRYGGEHARFAEVTNRLDGGGQVHQVSGVSHAPLSVGRRGAAPLPAYGPYFGRAPSPLAEASEDPEMQWLANQLRGLHTVDAPVTPALAALQRQRQGPPVPPVKSAATDDVAADYNAYYGYNFWEPGTSVYHDQPHALGYVTARPQRFVSDVSLDGYGGIARGLDTSIGGFVYNRIGNGSGIGRGHGLVHPHRAESYACSCQACAEYNRQFFSPSNISLDARDWPKWHNEYGVPVAENVFARGGFNQYEAFRFENGLMLDGRNVNFLHGQRDRKLQKIYFMTKDQNGCRTLQQKLGEGKDYVHVIFEGIIDHIAELMTNSFANYLVQKMLDVCDEEQRLRIIAVLTENPVKLLDVSINTHGTRAVQKLIETVRSKEQITLIISALEPVFMHLVKDPNGNHVIQKCLTNFGTEENKFIFEAAATHCFEMAVHRHGCCVLPRCISSARGEYQSKLIIEVCANGFELAQDPFGNYVVQYVLQLKFPSANAHLASQFKGTYVYLSKQKVSSNVVEKCLKFFLDNDKAVIVHELIEGPYFEELLQDPYANYVIYTALLQTRGSLNNELVEAIRPYEVALRTSPNCKRISRFLSRK